jgi:hypothetical protein
VRRVLGRFPDAPWGAHIELSSDPVAAAWQIAAIAPGRVRPATLLRATTMGGLLQQIIDLTLEVDEIWPEGESPPQSRGQAEASFVSRRASSARSSR